MKPTLRSVIVYSLCAFILALASGFLARKVFQGPRAKGINVHGRGMALRVDVPEGGLTLRQTMEMANPLPPSVNSAVVVRSNVKHLVRLRELFDTNGAGRMRLYGGDSVHLVHRSE